MAPPPSQRSDGSGTDLVEPAASYRFDRATFDRLFPFHLVIDRDLRIIRCGAVLQRVLPSLTLPGVLSEHFVIRRPANAVLEFDRFLEQPDRIYLVAALPPCELVLKGQMIPLEDEAALAFLGSPWITSLDQLARIGLTVADFAVHDSITDFLVLVQAQKTAIEDATNLAAQLADARDAALQTSRFKSEFLATMSHELRTPLNAILGFSEALAKAIFGPLPAKYRAYAGDIHRSGRLLLELINDLLDLSRIESGQYDINAEPVPLAALLEECVQLIGPEARRKGLALTLDCEPRDIELRGDRRALQQIAINLLSNAVKFTHEGSVSVRARQEPGWVVIDVADTGIGIPPAAIGELFEPFRQAAPEIARKYGGSGLGLSICRRLVALHGGRIDLESAPDKGTTATIRLPASRPL